VRIEVQAGNPVSQKKKPAYNCKFTKKKIFNIIKHRNKLQHSVQDGKCLKLHCLASDLQVITEFQQTTIEISEK